MEELGVGDSTQLCACPQGHTSPTFLSEETAFGKFLLLVCNRRTTSFSAIARDKFFVPGRPQFFLVFTFLIDFQFNHLVDLRLEIHLATPLSLILPRYSTRRNFEGLLSFIPEPEKVYRRRLNKLASCRILEDLGSQSLSDIHSLFLETNSQVNTNTSESDIMGEYFTQLDFSQIAGQPHRLPNKAVENLPMFTGTDAITSTIILEVSPDVSSLLSVILLANMMMYT